MPVGDMIEVWDKFDEEIAATPMPAYFPEKMVTLSLSKLIIKILWRIKLNK